MRENSIKKALHNGKVVIGDRSLSLKELLFHNSMLQQDWNLFISTCSTRPTQLETLLI